jgi:hypothetical protein
MYKYRENLDITILTTFRYNSISNAVHRVDVTTIRFNDPYNQDINVIICYDRQDQEWGSELNL